MFKYIIFLMLFLEYSLLYSQNSDSSKFSVQLNIGISNAGSTNGFLDFTKTSSTRRITSAFCAFNLNYLIKNNNTVGIGAQILVKGFKTSSKKEVVANSYNVAYRYTLDYLEVPIYYKHEFDNFGIIIGCVGSYLIRANWLYDYSKKIKQKLHNITMPPLLHHYLINLILVYFWVVLINTIKT